MAILTFVINLAGATMMLLFGVHLVKTGVERAFGPKYRAVIAAQNNVVTTSVIGICMAAILQSSAAVALMASGFSAGGTLALAPALALIIGADLGSALVVQILSFPIDRALPLLLLAGGWLFLRTERKPFRATGRAILGVAVILIALNFISAAASPISHTPILPVLAGYLESDPLAAFIIGAALAFVMHSSVATILLCAALVDQGAFGIGAGVAMVLGANAGSALIPVWLTRQMSVSARRAPIAVMCLRAPFALFVLGLLFWVVQPDTFGPSWATGGATIVLAHLSFNILFFVCALPFSHVLARFALRYYGQTPTNSQTLSPQWQTALDTQNPGTAPQAIAALKREILHMSDLVANMFRALPALYAQPDKSFIQQVRSSDIEVNACLERVRLFVAEIPHDHMDKPSKKEIRGLMEYAIRLESAGDVVAKRLCDLADEKRRAKADFSEQGRAEIMGLFEACTANIRLADEVLISDDVESARQLSSEKTELKTAEFHSRRRHLQRLRANNADSHATSDIHLETLRALREFNGHMAAVAYPLLYKNGLLLDSRLVGGLES